MKVYNKKGELIFEGADLWGADLRGADLQGADLQGANLQGAYLWGANLPAYQICPQEGSFIAWKALIDINRNKAIAKIRIPSGAKRTSSLVGRKCRAEFVRVLEGQGYSPTAPDIGFIGLAYKPGETVKADSYDDDPRLECTNGIHFYMTKEEAERH